MEEYLEGIQHENSCVSVCVCVTVCMWLTVHLMPVLQAAWCPAEAQGHRSATLPPLAAPDLASSSALTGPGVSAFVSQASSVSKPEHDHFPIVLTNQVEL